MSNSDTKTNPRLRALVADCKSAAREHDADVWSTVADRLQKPRSTHAEVNVGHIERHAYDDERVVVPGKVLGSGTLEKSVTVAAVDFSTSAEVKIARSGEPLTIERALERFPDGAGLRVMR